MVRGRRRGSVTLGVAGGVAGGGRDFLVAAKEAAHVEGQPRALGMHAGRYHGNRFRLPSAGRAPCHKRERNNRSKMYGLGV